MTYSYGVHLAQVEVDPETGRATVQRYLVEYEVGRAINPMLIEGQVRGGVAQGLGGTLLEELAYDEHGQPRAATLADYALPRALDVPAIEVYLDEDFPAASNPLGAKGVGEGGAEGVGAAVANAVADALGDRGARVTTLPLTAAAIRALLS